MIYLDENDIKNIGVKWDETINVIGDAVKCVAKNDFAQPIKPYLRYRDLKNRIISMPAFLGGDFNVAGIKWIASFPDNFNRGIPRAHSIVILNNADTGKPKCIINTALLSIIRTASVSGLMIKLYEKTRNLKNIKIGLSGFGPIGQYHLKMCSEILNQKIDKIYLYDIKGIEEKLIHNDLRNKIKKCDSWQEAYLDSDIFITCTVSKEPYIDMEPKMGSLHLNVSLRDYKADVFQWFKNSIIVDDWEEVCREKTDIETMHNKKGLQKEHTKSIVEIVEKNGLLQYADYQPIMFNPMGMAVFDLGIARYFMDSAISKGIEKQI